MDGKKRLLFLDDRTKRLMYALQELGKTYEVTICACVPEALRFLSEFDWDIVSLDHDLNGHDFQDTHEPDCAMKLIRYLEDTGWPESKPKPIFWIHSSNLFAANKMIIKLLKIGIDAYYQPISKKDVYMKYDKKGNPL